MNKKTRKFRTLLIITLTNLLICSSLWAQSPEKMSYQAVIRNTSGTLVTSTQIGIEINIRQGTPTGTIVYTETQTPTTNANGLVSIVIGGGAGFSSINWSAGLYFIESKTDIAGGTNYTITGTSQILSVPYALHAKSAETLTGGITETDPVFGSSVASGINATDTTYWNNKLDVAPGTVLQMVVLTSETTSSLDVTNFTEAHQDYRISITPKGINSIFIIEYYFSINTQLASNTVFHMQLIRDIGGTEVPIGIGPVNALRDRTTFVSRPNNGYDINDQQSVYLVAKDANLTFNNNYTYGFKYRRESGGSGTTYFNYTNGNSSEYGFSSIMLMKVTEIAQ
ncbi:MAG TPA: hypothetical protein PLC59_05400 [Bacteroidales bacterium]|nr:hypothetical protein [Bacteroidales bacterium]